MPGSTCSTPALFVENQPTREATPPPTNPLMKVGWTDSSFLPRASCLFCFVLQRNCLVLIVSSHIPSHLQNYWEIKIADLCSSAKQTMMQSRKQLLVCCRRTQCPRIRIATILRVRPVLAVSAYMRCSCSC